jgi:hypothetical protein
MWHPWLSLMAFEQTSAARVGAFSKQIISKFLILLGDLTVEAQLLL